MDVLIIVAGIALAAGLLYGAYCVAMVGLAWAMLIVWGLWPIILGLGIGIVIGTMGFTNIGVLVALGGIVGQFLWFRRFGESDSDSSSGPNRRTLYNKEGEPIGSIDNE